MSIYIANCLLIPELLGYIHVSYQTLCYDREIIFTLSFQLVIIVSKILNSKINILSMIFDRISGANTEITDFDIKTKRL